MTLRLQFGIKFQQYQKTWWGEHGETCEQGWKSVYAMVQWCILVMCVQSEINRDIMKCTWNKMAFNIHSFCNNKLKIKIKFHCFIYVWKSQVPLPVIWNCQLITLTVTYAQEAVQMVLIAKTFVVDHTIFEIALFPIICNL
jgi:hypothetical protein